MKHTNTHLLPAKSFLLFTCLCRYPEVPIMTDQLRLTTLTQHPLRNVPASQIKTSAPRAGEFLHQLQRTHKHTQRTHTLVRWRSKGALFCIREAARGVLWVCESARESEREEAGAEEFAQQSISILNAQMETVWRLWRGWNNHRLAERLKHLGDGESSPSLSLKHRALTWCSSHAPLYWCPCPIHWGGPVKHSRSLKGAASLRIWSCGCRRREAKLRST